MSSAAHATYWPRMRLCSLRRLVTSVREALPVGRTLPEDVWVRRHRAMIWLLWLHAVGLTFYAEFRGYGLIHSLGHGLPVVAFAAVGSLRSLGRRLRSTSVSAGLLTCSALLVHSSGGVIEAHFHFFVMIGVIALYEDWLPFLVAFAYVVGHHGLAGALAPSSVYNHAAAIEHPWKWAAIHGVFVMGAGAASVVAWRLNEDVRARLRHEHSVALLLREVAVAANESGTVEQALQTCLERVCAQTGWPVGHVYLRTEASEGELASAGIWYLEDSLRFEPFRAVSAQMTFRSGVGLPGRVLASGQPAWIVETATDPNFPRAHAADVCGLVSAFAFPVRVGADVVAVLEFFSERTAKPDEELLEVMDHVGTQLGRAFERKQAEEEQSRFFTLSRDLVGIVGQDGYLKHVNPAWERTLGFTTDELTSQPLISFIHPDDRPRSAEGGQLLRAGRPLNAFENRYVCKDGSIKWFLWNAVATPGGELIYASGHDITERKRIEEERERLLAKEREQVERLQEIDRLKDDFVASVSHELRTPLTSIRGYLELVLDREIGELTDEQRSFLGVVDRNSERLLRLVGDLLFVAQVDAGRLTLEAGEVDLTALARECVEAAGPLAEEKGIELALVGDSPPVVSGDRARLAQLLDNLVSNGLKFTPAGGRVEVKTAASNGHVVVEVADTGIGIAPADQVRLFERFFRAGTATEQAIQGTGLGLWITKAIAEAHGGGISVASAEGSGTTFRVHLPALTNGAPSALAG